MFQATNSATKNSVVILCFGEASLSEVGQTLRSNQDPLNCTWPGCWLFIMWCRTTSGSKGPGARAPPCPPRFVSKSCAFFRQFFWKNPCFEQNLGSGPPPLGVKTPLGPLWPKSWIRRWEQGKDHPSIEVLFLGGTVFWSKPLLLRQAGMQRFLCHSAWNLIFDTNELLCFVLLFLGVVWIWMDS